VAGVVPVPANASRGEGDHPVAYPPAGDQGSVMGSDPTHLGLGYAPSPRDVALVQGVGPSLESRG